MVRQSDGVSVVLLWRAETSYRKRKLNQLDNKTMKPEELEKWLKEGSKESSINFHELIHNPEFEKEMENEPWNEYEKEDFQ
jgi:hypothetical protein